MGLKFRESLISRFYKIKYQKGKYSKTKIICVYCYFLVD